MDAPPVELAIQVLEGTSLPYLSSLESGADALIISAAIGAHVRETLGASVKSPVSGRATWLKGNVLSWALSAHALAVLKASSPTVRLNLIVRGAADAPGSAGTSAGYVLVPLRVAEMSLSSAHAPFDDWLPSFLARHTQHNL